MAVVFVVRFLVVVVVVDVHLDLDVDLLYLTLPPGQLNSNCVVHKKMFKLLKCCL